MEPLATTTNENNNYQLYILYKAGLYCVNPFKNKSEKLIDVPKASNVISSKNFLEVSF